jgi:TonB family protein
MTRQRLSAAPLALVVAALGVAVAPAVHAQTTEGLGIRQPAEEQPPQQIEATKLSKVPKQTKFVQADYPPEAAQKGIEADVILLLDINAEGKVDSVGIAEPSQSPGMGFEEAALVAAQQFEFEPAEVEGKPIAVQLSYKYKFRLSALPKPATDGGAGADGGVPPDAGASDAGAPDGAPPPPPPPATPERKPVVNFTGVLRERGTRLPLAGVVVTVFRDEGEKPVGFEASSDADGRFEFVDLEPGDWKVLAEPPGYFPFRTTETISPNEKVDVVYYVEKGEYNPYDVTVTATRPRKEVSRTSIAAAEIDKIPGTAGDPLAVIQNFAGVARTPVAGLLIVRGSAPEDSRVFVDGTEVPFIYHFGGLRSVIPIGLLDSIDFYPGNFSAQYGRATGGIIDVQIKKLKPKKIGGYADVSLLDTSVFLEVPLGDKGAVAVGGRRSYIDYLIKAAVPDNAPVSFVTAPRYYDYQLLANYRPAPAHDLRFLLFGSDDRFEILFKNPSDLDTNLQGGTASNSTTFYRSLLEYRYVPGTRFENSLRLSEGRNWVNFDFAQFTFNLNIYSSQVRDTVRYKFGDRLTLVSGLDFLFSRTTGFIRFPRPPKEGEPPGPPDLSQVFTTNITGNDYWSPAPFLELEWKPFDKLLVLPGVRADYFSRIHEGIVQPRLTTRWQFADQLTAKGGAGFFVQEPDFDETDPAFGNPDLKGERAMHYSAGVEWKPRPYITLDATGFYKDMWNLVGPTDREVMVNGVSKPLVYDNGATGRVYGLELVARHEFTNNFSGWLAYTLSRSTRIDSGKTEERLFDFDQTHILTLIASYLLPRNWQVGGRLRLVSGNPITPIRGGVYNASTDQYDPVYGPVNSARNPLFNQLDLRVDKRWVYQSWMLNLYLDIQNIYDQANGEGLNYNYNFRKSSTATGLPILTILGIRAEF